MVLKFFLFLLDVGLHLTVVLQQKWIQLSQVNLLDINWSVTTYSHVMITYLCNWLLNQNYKREEEKFLYGHVQYSLSGLNSSYFLCAVQKHRVTVDYVHRRIPWDRWLNVKAHIYLLERMKYSRINFVHTFLRLLRL